MYICSQERIYIQRVYIEYKKKILCCSGDRVIIIGDRFNYNRHQSLLVILLKYIFFHTLCRLLLLYITMRFSLQLIKFSQIYRHSAYISEHLCFAFLLTLIFIWYILLINLLCTSLLFETIAYIIVL